MSRSIGFFLCAKLRSDDAQSSRAPWQKFWPSSTQSCSISQHSRLAGMQHLSLKMESFPSRRFRRLTDRQRLIRFLHPQDNAAPPETVWRDWPAVERASLVDKGPSRLPLDRATDDNIILHQHTRCLRPDSRPWIDTTKLATWPRCWVLPRSVNKQCGLRLPCGGENLGFLLNQTLIPLFSLVRMRRVLPQVSSDQEHPQFVVWCLLHC
jgi:hypothetical protein